MRFASAFSGAHFRSETGFHVPVWQMKVCKLSWNAILDRTFVDFTIRLATRFVHKWNTRRIYYDFNQNQFIALQST